MESLKLDYKIMKFTGHHIKAVSNLDISLYYLAKDVFVYNPNQVNAYRTGEIYPIRIERVDKETWKNFRESFT